MNDRLTEQVRNELIQIRREKNALFNEEAQFYLQIDGRTRLGKEIKREGLSTVFKRSQDKAC